MTIYYRSSKDLLHGNIYAIWTANCYHNTKIFDTRTGFITLNDTIDILQEKFRDRLISKKGGIDWSPRSFDLAI